jgi:hypothetical protein
MRWWVALLTVCGVLVTVSGASASAPPGAASVTPGSVWTLQSEGTCETDSFGTSHSFSATGSSSGVNGEEGTYRQDDRLTMRWTAGASVGGIFKGSFHKRDDEYVGTYGDAGASATAYLEPVSRMGCAELTATVAPDPQTLGDSVTDSVSVTGSGSGGATPAGSVTFSVCPGDTDPCDPDAADAVALGTVDLTGTGNTVSATNTFRPTTTGSFCFSDLYVGDNHYSPVLDSSIANHCFTVTPAGSVVTSAPGDTSIELGTSDTDTAIVTSTAEGVVPTGTVTFYECGPDTTPTACAVPPAAAGTGTEFGSPVTLVSADTTATATSAAFTPTATGIYCFVAVYSGDANNTSGSDGSSTGECFTVEPQTSSGSPGPVVGLMALNKYGPHEILAGGTGEFVVSGNIFLNTDVASNPWSGDSGGWGWDDAIDAKDGSNVNVYGTIDSQTSTYNGQPVWPMDVCFEPEGIIGDVTTNPDSSTQTQLSSGNPPSVQLTCASWGGSVSINYDNINPNNTQIDDPVMASAVPDPLTTSLPCPGQSTMAVNPTPTVVDGVTDYTPGRYTTPVDITTNATFESCPGGDWGVYDFEDGLAIDPPAGDTVSGSNAVIATQTPYPEAGNVPGSGTGPAFVPSGTGNGAPCLPAGTMTSPPSGHGSPQNETTTYPCGGTSPTTYGVIAYTDASIAPDPSMSGTGSNFSLMIGGGGTVNLSGPTDGAFGGTNGQPGVVLYQDPSTEANYGFNAEPGDAATINLTGIVYNASLADYGVDSPLDYWDGIGGAVPFYAGGTLQTGYGTGWSDGPPESAGTVTLSGAAVVDDFNTDGSTTITLFEAPYALPAVESSVVHLKVHRKRP